MSAEKRRYPRYAFPNEDEINAQLALPNGGGFLKARLLNISLGGMGLAIEKSHCSSIEDLDENVELHLQSIQGNVILGDLTSQKVLVKWILNYDPLKNIGIGCEFIELKKEYKDIIAALLIQD